MKSILILVGINLIGLGINANPVQGKKENLKINSLISTETLATYKSEKPKSFTIPDFSFSLDTIERNDYYIKIKYQGVPTRRYLQISYDFSDRDYGTHQTTFPKYSNFTDEVYFYRGNFSGTVHARFYVISPIYESSLDKVFMEFDLSASKMTLTDSNEAYIYSEVSYTSKTATTSVKGEKIEFVNIKHTYEISDDFKFSLNDLALKIKGKVLKDEKYFKRFTAYLTLVGTTNSSYKSSKTLDKGPFTTNSHSLKVSYPGEYASLKAKTVFYVDKKTYKTYSSKEKESYIETKDFYFPISSYEYFKEFKMNLEIYRYGYYETAFVFPISVKFINISFNYDYEVIGEIDRQIETDELEEVTL